MVDRITEAGFDEVSNSGSVEAEEPQSSTEVIVGVVAMDGKFSQGSRSFHCVVIRSRWLHRLQDRQRFGLGQVAALNFIFQKGFAMVEISHGLYGVGDPVYPGGYMLPERNEPCEQDPLPSFNSHAMRIASGGINHETGSCVKTRATLEDFENGRGFDVFQRFHLENPTRGDGELA